MPVMAVYLSRLNYPIQLEIFVWLLVAIQMTVKTVRA